MAKKKPKLVSPFHGRWHIVSMTEWDEDYLNEEVQAFIEFDDKGGGSFQFGYVQGFMDCRETTRDGKPCIEWSWEGNDEMDPAQGRGWAVVEGDRLKGMIFFHQGDDSGFEAGSGGEARGPTKGHRAACFFPVEEGQPIEEPATTTPYRTGD